MKHFLMIFSLYSTLFSLPCLLVYTNFPSRVFHTPIRLKNGVVLP